MSGPFSRDGRDFYINPNGKLFSFDAGFDPSTSYAGFTPATEADVVKNDSDKAYEKKDFLDKAGESIDAFGNAAVRGVVSLAHSMAPNGLGAQGLAGIDAPAEETQALPAATNTEIKASAPSVYSDEAMAIKERHGIASALGSGVSQLPVAAFTGGESIPAQLSAIAARGLASGAMTEADDAVIEDRDFDVEKAAYNGAVAGAFDGAFTAAPRLFRGANNFFKNTAEAAELRGIKDAAKDYGPKQQEKLRDFGPEVSEERIKQVKDNVRTLDQNLRKENDFIFSEKNISKKINKAPIQYVDDATRSITGEIENLADDIERRASDADYAQTQNQQGSREAAHLEQFVGDLEREGLERGRVGSGPMEIDIHRDAEGFNPINKQAEITERIAEYRKRQGIFEPAARDAAEPGIELHPDYGPPVPKEKNLFGVGELDNSPHEGIQASLRELENYKPTDQLPHGLKQAGIDDKGNAFYDLVDDPSDQAFINTLKSVVENPEPGVLSRARDAIQNLTKDFPQAGKRYMDKLDEIARLVPKNEVGDIYKSGLATSKTLKGLVAKAEAALESGSNAKTWSTLRSLRNTIDNYGQLNKEVGAAAEPILDKIDDFLGDSNVWGKIGKEYANTKIAYGDIAKDPNLNWMNVDEFSQQLGGVPGPGSDLNKEYMKTMIRRAYDSPNSATKKLAARLEFEMDNVAAQQGSAFFSRAGRQTAREWLSPGSLENLPYWRRFPEDIRTPFSRYLHRKGREYLPGLIPSEDAAAALYKKPEGFTPALVTELSSGAKLLFNGVLDMGIPIPFGMGAALGAAFKGGKMAFENPAVRKSVLGAARAVTGFAAMTADNTIGTAARFLTNPSYRAAASNMVYNQYITDVRKETGYNALGISSFIGGYGNLRTAFNARKSQIEKISSDPMALVDEMSESWGDLADLSPDGYNALIQKTHEALAFVQSKIPTTVGQSMLRRDGIPPSNIQMRQFALYYSSATNPSSVIDDLALGSATVEQMEGLRTVWPKIYTDLKAQVITSIAETTSPPTLNQRQRLDILFDFGDQLDGALSNSLALRADLARKEKKEQSSGRPPQSNKTGQRNAASTLPEGLEMMKNPMSVYG